MLRLVSIIAAGMLLAACFQDEAKPVPVVDLQGRLVVDQAITASRQAQGIEGEYYSRVVSVNGEEMGLNDFIVRYCPDRNTRDETCLRAARIKKIDDVSGATRFLPNGL